MTAVHGKLFLIFTDTSVLKLVDELSFGTGHWTPVEVTTDWIVLHLSVMTPGLSQTTSSPNLGPATLVLSHRGDWSSTTSSHGFTGGNSPGFETTRPRSLTPSRDPSAPCFSSKTM